MTSTIPGIGAQRITGRVGAVLTGVQLGPDLSNEEVRSIRQALLDHKVVFIPDQGHLDDARHIGFGRLLGEVTGVPGLEPSDVAELDSRLGVRANVWHTDVTFVPQPFAFSILRAVEVPAFGGDTMFANTAAAYASLPEDLRNLVDGLWAVHTNDYDYAAAFGDQDPEVVAEMTKAFRSTRFETHHPVVRVHPETKERTLLLGGFAQKIVGHSARESAHLLDLLSEHITRPEHTMRWTWSVGDVAIWDNRATQHYAVNDYDDATRIMRRVTIAGDAPVSVNGQTSRAVTP
jgi:taurine dioxygenase